MLQIEHFKLALEIVGFVPLDDGVFDLANAAQVAVNLHNAIWILMVSVLVVVEHCLLRGLTQLRHEPLYTVDVKHALHAEEVDSDFDDVALTDLHDWLDQGPLLDSLNLISSLEKPSAVILDAFF